MHRCCASFPLEGEGSYVSFTTACCGLVEPGRGATASGRGVWEDPAVLISVAATAWQPVLFHHGVFPRDRNTTVGNAPAALEDKQ
jgi:hypothetical protein